ncbi:hypothetical protein [Kribbella sp. NPDC051718]|uniref:hypothetical protein n=1 Tax=Kribbella sp. NPDC051718 TaxID=3155168 RepID=UPI00342A9BEB
MRTFLSKPPAWAVGLVSGVPFGIGMGFFIKSDGDSLRASMISGTVLGVAFGVAMAFTLRRQLHLLVRTVGSEISPADRRAAGRALRRGPVPADPRIRAAAIRLARNQLELLQRWRLRSLVIFGLLLAVSITGVFAGSHWGITLVALYLFGLGYQLVRPRMLRSRLDELTQGFEEHGS